MRNGWRALLLLVALTGVCLAGDPPKEPGRRPLPSLLLSDSAGATVNVADLGNTGHWLLVYVNAHHPGCEAMLNQLKADRYGAYASRIVIVVGGVKSDSVFEWSKQFPDLATAHWLADPQRTAMTALQLHGFPVEIGVNDNNIEWRLAGAPRDTEMFDATLLNWLKASN